MGSIVTLGVGLLEVDWGKNNLFRNHSALFLPSDKSSAPYYYADDIVEEKEALVRKLINVKERIELLGYSLPNTEHRFNSLLKDFQRPSYQIGISYEDFASAIFAVEISKVRLVEGGDYDFGELARTIIKDPEFNKVIDFSMYSKWDIGEFLENVDPYIVLRLLMENPANHEEFLVWGYKDIVNGGWAEPNEICLPLNERQKFLIVTEGSTDSYILLESLRILKPDIADFFHFIDMEDNYPFTGSGNLYRFCQGLASIGIQNKIIVIFDNDTEGIEKYNLASQLTLPGQMMIMRLPDLDQFNEFDCIGPNGVSKENINGRAVSIECFLDLSKARSQPRVRWTSYNSRLGTYQGEIEHKQAYVKSYKKSKSDKDYDTAKLIVLLSCLYDTCIRMPGLKNEGEYI